MTPPDGRVAARDVLARLRVEASGSTTARVFLEGAPGSLSTRDALALLGDHAAARDAVHDSVTVTDPALRHLVRRDDLFGVASAAPDRATYLARPDLGRRLADGEAARLAELGTPGADLQVVLGDGLSARAVATYGPAVLEHLHARARALGWSVGRPFLVSQCRVGVLNEIGDALGSTTVVLLIGERPGLATPCSLSAYLAHRPTAGDTDAERNLVSNVHDHGVAPETAAERVVDLLRAVRARGASGVAVKESLASRVSVEGR